MLNSIDVADGERLLNAGAAVFVDSGMNEVQITRFPTDERIDDLRYETIHRMHLIPSE